jgi:hypothetical protein
MIVYSTLPSWLTPYKAFNIRDGRLWLSPLYELKPIWQHSLKYLSVENSAVFVEKTLQYLLD